MKSRLPFNPLEDVAEQHIRKLRWAKWLKRLKAGAVGTLWGLIISIIIALLGGAWICARIAPLVAGLPWYAPVLAPAIVFSLFGVDWPDRVLLLSIGALVGAGLCLVFLVVDFLIRVEPLGLTSTQTAGGFIVCTGMLLGFAVGARGAD